MLATAATGPTNRPSPKRRRRETQAAVQLTKLDLSHNALGSVATGELVESLARCRLSHLSLASCDLDVHAARGLAFLLDNSLVLKELDISWNRFGSEGCKVIAEALQFNQSVERLEMGYNALGAAGGAFLGEVLYDNRCAALQNAECFFATGPQQRGVCCYRRRAA